VPRLWAKYVPEEKYFSSGTYFAHKRGTLLPVQTLKGAEQVNWHFNHVHYIPI